MVPPKREIVSEKPDVVESPVLGSGRPSSLAPAGRLAGDVLGHRASRMHPQTPQETAAGAMSRATQEVEAAMGCQRTQVMCQHGRLHPHKRRSEPLVCSVGELLCWVHDLPVPTDAGWAVVWLS